MTIDKEEMVSRCVAWQQAEELVKPIAQHYQPESYRSGYVFGHNTEITPLEQHLDAIERVANWIVNDS